MALVDQQPKQDRQRQRADELRPQYPRPRRERQAQHEQDQRAPTAPPRRGGRGSPLAATTRARRSEHQEAHPPQAIEPVRERLPEPFVIRPVAAGHRVRVVLHQRNVQRPPDLLPGAQVPEGIALPPASGRRRPRWRRTAAPPSSGGRSARASSGRRRYHRPARVGRPPAGGLPAARVSAWVSSRRSGEPTLTGSTLSGQAAAKTRRARSPWAAAPGAGGGRRRPASGWDRSWARSRWR